MRIRMKKGGDQMEENYQELLSALYLKSLKREQASLTSERAVFAYVAYRFWSVSVGCLDMLRITQSSRLISCQ
jgi:hypothetical protein